MRLLIIGALGGQISGASQIATTRGAKVSQANDIEAGLAALRSGNGADVIMIDSNLDIAKLVSSLESERINVPVVACGIDGESKTAVQAIKAGAQEFIPLPPDEELIAAVFEAVSEDASSIVYKDPLMAKTLKLAEQVSNSNASILVVGQSGTGKELIARHIHQKSPRSRAPFVAINCAAIPENLLESELFGYERGSFTGAVARRLGKFEEANKGTLLLDEISEMDFRLQAKLLRAVQEQEIDRIGGKGPVKVDVRIIATSNRNMEEQVKNGKFREDLYFRLNVITIEVPRLVERPGDIQPLADFFTAKYAEANGLGKIVLSDEAKALLKNHSWPGNVRELENTIHRGVLLAIDGEITPDSIVLQNSSISALGSGLTVETSAEKSNVNLIGKTVAEVEQELIIETLTHCLGNRTHAANILGISIRTLRNKLKLYTEQDVIVPSPGNRNEQAPT
ncbi:MAG TPA: sigma-54-dependent Fis family transcriptional regulator [Rhodospirillales bacterium]|nr:sigma-54-dependent Fis family transcriptional regulator [Rhodospirillales bacterium]